jgi:uncharacterized protein YqeY
VDLKTSIQNDMKTAMKASEPLKVSTLRMLISEIKKREIDKRSPVEEPEIHKIISGMIKQRLDSIDQFSKGGRPELAEKEQQELDILKAYLPAQLSVAEIETIVVQAIAEVGATKPEDMGKVMKAALAKTGGRADGKLLNDTVRSKLAKPA